MSGRRGGMALLLCVAACGRFRFDESTGTGSGSAIDAPRSAVDSGIAPAHCPAKPSQTGTLVTTAAELQSAVTAATSGTTILVADGTYALTSPLTVLAANVTIRSASDNAGAVILDAGGAFNPIIYIQASDVQIISLTLRRSADEGIVVEPTNAGSITGDVIYDVTFIDNIGTSLRGKPFQTLAAGPYADNSEVGCSRFIHTQPSMCEVSGCYGVRLMGVRGWKVHDNYFAGQCSPVRSRSIWADSGTRDTTIVDNVFSNNMNNILVGNTSLRVYADSPPTQCTTTPQFWGGQICNNRIAGLGVAVNSTGADFDEGIALWTTCDTWVMHNTVVSPADTFENIEYRFAGTYVHLFNNLTGMAAVARDSGALDPASQNFLFAATSDFVDAPAGDLHLAAGAAEPPGAAITMCGIDADGKTRNMVAPTPGAYER